MARVMKDSGIEWIGEIPEEWEVTRLGKYFIERNSKVSDYDYEPLSVTKQGIVKQLKKNNYQRNFITILTVLLWLKNIKQALMNHCSIQCLWIKSWMVSRLFKRFQDLTVLAGEKKILLFLIL